MKELPSEGATIHVVGLTDVGSAVVRYLLDHPATRILIWLVVVASLPWLTAPIIYRVIEHKSNALSATLLGGYGIADLLLLLALTGFTVTGNKPALLIMVALSAAMIYNYWACEKIAEDTK